MAKSKTCPKLILPKRGNEYPRHYNAKCWLYQWLQERGVQDLQSEEKSFSVWVYGPQYTGYVSYWPDITCRWKGKDLAFEIDDKYHNVDKDEARDEKLREKYNLWTVRLPAADFKKYRNGILPLEQEISYQIAEQQ